MKDNVCCFTGHRKIPEHRAEHIRRRVYEEAENLICTANVDTFICGGAVGFDMLCGVTVLQLKSRYSTIKLIMVLPCHEQNKYYSARDKEIYAHLLLNADNVIYVSENYYNGCMHERNRYMADNSAYMIAYCMFSRSGTAYTVEYGRQRGTNVIAIN